MGVKIITVNSSVEGGAPSGTLDITQNGEYNISAYEKVDVEVEGGGGGSSDFSTALVTISYTGTKLDNFSSLRFILCNAIDTGEFAGTIGSIAIDSFGGLTQTATVILYKGKASAYREYTSLDYDTTLTGDIEYDADNGDYIITGDCTITISDK